MAAPVVVILAAGQGTRMRSELPKLLHPMCGRALIGWPLAAAEAAGASKLVVVDSPGEPLRDHLPESVELAIQAEPRGTGDALRAASGHLSDADQVIVLYGDVPLIRPETLIGLAEAHAREAAAATLLTAVVDDPSGYGRIVRDAAGNVERVVETKTPGDATEAELRIHEVNTGIYAFAGELLKPALELIGSDNAQGEYYLPDVLPILRAQGHRVTAFELGDPLEMFNVNDRVALARAGVVAQRQINERHMLAGVTIVNPEATLIDVDVELEPDATILPFTSLRGRTRVGSGSVVGPATTLIDTAVGVGSTVIHAYATQARIEDGVDVGPFAYLRPGTVLHNNSKAGTFVELKNTEVGERSKVPHLSYVGDTTIGEDTNLGASTITANYDGYTKSRTTIGSGVHTGVDTTFVAPVEIGDDAFTGAGSVITKDVPPGALGIARARQSNVEGYAERKREQQDAETRDQQGKAQQP